MTVRGDLELCDCEVAGESQATKLTFVVGADAKSGLVDVKGAFKIGQNAKLDIDFGGFAGRRITLLKASSIKGAFKSENVAVRNRTDLKPVVYLRNGRLSVSIDRGFGITIR